MQRLSYRRVFDILGELEQSDLFGKDFVRSDVCFSDSCFFLCFFAKCYGLVK